MDYQVVFSRTARTDLRDIVRYVSFDDPDLALTFSQFLISQAKSLRVFPERGRIVPEFDNDRIREIVVRSYRIVYRVDHANRVIEIVRIWHASRGIPLIGS